MKVVEGEKGDDQYRNGNTGSQDRVVARRQHDEEAGKAPSLIFICSWERVWLKVKSP